MGKRKEKSCTRVEEGTVKQLHVIGVGTTVSNISELHTAGKNTNTHIHIEAFCMIRPLCVTAFNHASAS